MRASKDRWQAAAVAILACLMAVSTLESALAAAPARSMVSALQEQFGLNEGQVLGGLGVMLVFARDRLPKPEFDQLAARMPNAERLMQMTKQQGIVNTRLDSTSDFERALTNLGIAPATASQFVSAVLGYMDSAGYYRERDILARVMK
jgi:Protein of unknown function VcgC/VcgE (DUF2780)